MLILLLSYSRIVFVISSSSSLMNFLIHTTSLATYPKAMYLAFVVDVEKVCYFLLFHNTTALFKKNNSLSPTCDLLGFYQSCYRHSQLSRMKENLSLVFGYI